MASCFHRSIPLIWLIGLLVYLVLCAFIFWLLDDKYFTRSQVLHVQTNCLNYTDLKPNVSERILFWANNVQSIDKEKVGNLVKLMLQRNSFNVLHREIMQIIDNFVTYDEPPPPQFYEKRYIDSLIESSWLLLTLGHFKYRTTALGVKIYIFTYQIIGLAVLLQTACQIGHLFYQSLHYIHTCASHKCVYKLPPKSTFYSLPVLYPIILTIALFAAISIWCWWLYGQSVVESIGVATNFITTTAVFDSGEPRSWIELVTVFATFLMICLVFLHYHTFCHRLDTFFLELIEDIRSKQELLDFNDVISQTPLHRIYWQFLGGRRQYVLRKYWRKMLQRNHAFTQTSNASTSSILTRPDLDIASTPATSYDEQEPEHNSISVSVTLPQRANLSRSLQSSSVHDSSKVLNEWPITAEAFSEDSEDENGAVFYGVLANMPPRKD